MLAGASTLVAVLIGIPLGIAAFRYRVLRGPLLGIMGILQTVPSLAMLAILLTVLHRIGSIPALIALILYAFLPIVRNTLTGLESVTDDIRDAARGVGMTSRQQLWIVELPLAFPMIIAGIRTAAVIGIGVATLSAFIGAGGLGQFINRGLALSNTNLILLGAIPAAFLALAVDGTIASVQWAAKAPRTGAFNSKRLYIRVLRGFAFISPVLLCAIGGAPFVPNLFNLNPRGGPDPSSHVIRIGSKNFTEQLILAEFMAQVIEVLPGFKVERKFNLGGTLICHGALKNNEIDLYAEYTGTGLTAILKKDPVTNPDRAYEIVSLEYPKEHHLQWLKPFGFNNTYAITVRRKDAEEKKIKKISDLARLNKTLKGGFTAEFMERPDGYPGLKEAYGLHFKKVVDLDPAIMYQAIADGEVDVICAFATDGRIQSFDLEPLKDNFNFFPPYFAAPVIRDSTLKKYPEIKAALDQLGGLLDDAMMQKLNYSVDEEKKSPSDVARGFLVDRKIITLP